MPGAVEALNVTANVFPRNAIANAEAVRPVSSFTARQDELVRLAPAEAEALYRRALRSDETTYGPSHANVARDLSNLAGFLAATRRAAEARKYIARAVEITSIEPASGNRRAAVIVANAARISTPADWQQLRRSPTRGLR